MKIAVLGCSGRMGQMLAKAVLEAEGAELAGATERKGSDWVGQDLGAWAGLPGAAGVTVVDDPLPVFASVERVQPPRPLLLLSPGGRRFASGASFSRIRTRKWTAANGSSAFQNSGRTTVPDSPRAK